MTIVYIYIASFLCSGIFIRVFPVDEHDEETKAMAYRVKESWLVASLTPIVNTIATIIGFVCLLLVAVPYVVWLCKMAVWKLECWGIDLYLYVFSSERREALRRLKRIKNLK